MTPPIFVSYDISLGDLGGGENCSPPLTPPRGRTKKGLKLKIILIMFLNEIKKLLCGS